MMPLKPNFHAAVRLGVPGKGGPPCIVLCCTTCMWIVFLNSAYEVEQAMRNHGIECTHGMVPGDLPEALEKALRELEARRA